jgi:alanine racemase
MLDHIKDVAESECVLEISLSNIRANWRLLQSKCPTAKCAATVKANAYGLGADKVAPALYREGCRNFFVVNIKEALILNKSLPTDDKELRIYVIYGFYNNHSDVFDQHRHICPVLSSLSQVLEWSRFCEKNTSINKYPIIILIFCCINFLFLLFLELK